MTTKSLFLSLAALSAVSASPVPQWEGDIKIPSIVGGVPATAGDFPFIVSFQKNGQHFCGGSLIDSTTVLTAAHCVDGQSLSGLTVRAGTLTRNAGGVTAAVSELHAHPNYNADTQDSDLGILKLATPIPESSTVKYATLAAAGSDPVGDSIATVAGWGNTQNSTESTTTLRRVDVPIVARETCVADYAADSPPKEVTENMVCAGLDAGGKDSCQGDSGGPIVDDQGTVIGAVSWGTGCALAGFPGVYARVGSLRAFIDEYL